jgi:hypothetical protein
MGVVRRGDGGHCRGGAALSAQVRRRGHTRGAGVHAILRRLEVATFESIVVALVRVMRKQ